MLAAHGLVIVAEQIKSIDSYEFTSRLKFWIASDIGQGKTQRFLLELVVPNKELEIVKPKIEIGKVCEIIKADIREIQAKTDIPNRFTTNIVLLCKLENFKFLTRCIYYEDLPNITKEIK